MGIKDSPKASMLAFLAEVFIAAVVFFLLIVFASKSFIGKDWHCTAEAPREINEKPKCIKWELKEKE